MWRFHFFCSVSFPSQNLPRGKTMWRFNFFCCVNFSDQKPSTTQPFRVTNQNLPEAYNSMRSKNKPKAHTFQKPTPDWDTIHRGENHVAFSLFLLSSFSQPEPSTTQPFWVTNQETSRSLQLKEKPKTNPKLKPSRSLHLNKMLYKGGKTMWRFHFFCSVSFPSQYLPRHNPFELRTKTFQKPTTRWEAKNKPNAHTFQKPTPDWDTIHRGKTMWRFHFFCWVHFPSQNLPQHSPFELRTKKIPEAYSSRRSQKQTQS